MAFAHRIPTLIVVGGLLGLSRDSQSTIVNVDLDILLRDPRELKSSSDNIPLRILVKVHSNECFGKYVAQCSLVHVKYVPRLEGPHCSAPLNFISESTSLRSLTGTITLTSEVVEEAVEIVERLVEENVRHVDGRLENY